MKRRLIEEGAPCFTFCHGHCNWCEVRFRCFTSRGDYLVISTAELYICADISIREAPVWFHQAWEPLKSIYTADIWEKGEN